MKLWFAPGSAQWEPARYHYAAEQMMLTLFPGERPEYPDAPPPGGMEGEESAAVFTLHRGRKLSTMSALVFWGNGRRRGVARFPSAELDAPEEQVYHTVQRALKQAFYRAGAALLGHDLPWGSLTGVRPTKLPTRALWNGATPAQARRELERVYRVSPGRAALAVACAGHSVRARRSLEGDEVSLYVGIPFCPSRCVYCSFVSSAVDRCLPLVEPFVAALGRETEAAGRSLSRAGRAARTVYLGGGTPTTLSPAQLDAVLSALEAQVGLARCTELTVEAGRPDTITPEKLAVLAGHGVGRVSVNPQSMDDAVLAQMGRPHTAADVRRAYDQVRGAGAFVVNMDLIAGLPGDTPAGFAKSLEEVLALGPENVTVHTLALKKGAKLRQRQEELPSGREAAQMLDGAWEALAAAGYEPYYLYRQKYMSGALENVGWARPGTESLYNIVMMEELHTVLALGGGGVSKLVEPRTGRLSRLANPKYPQEYLRDIDKLCEEKENIPWPIS